MHILRRVHKLELNRLDDTKNPFAGRPLSEGFKDYSKRNEVYQLRPEVFELLLNSGAVMFDSSASGPDLIAEGQQDEYTFVFERIAKHSAQWLDRIMAYIAFHDGFKTAHNGFVLDTTYNRPVGYDPDENSRPLSVHNWMRLSNAWLGYMLATWHEGGDEKDHKKDLLATQELLQHTMILMRHEMGYNIDFIERDDNFSIVFKGGFNGRASVRFWIDQKEPDAGIKYAIANPSGTTDFPQVLTVGKLHDIVHQTIADWHREASLNPDKALAFFDLSHVDLWALWDTPFRSGLPEYKAKVTSLPRPKR